MLRFLRLSGLAALLLATAPTGRAQQAAPAAGAEATPRVITGGAPRAEPVPGTPALAAEPVAQSGGRMTNLNALIVDVVREMPQGGGYATNAGSFAALRQSIRPNGGGRLTVVPAQAQPSFCSGATYVVLLRVIEELLESGQLRLTDEAIMAIEVRSQPDGTGIWGRWNANGPGTARLFHELGLGRNFTDYAEARPGDFIKMFWNDQIGSKERGHLAVFLGASKDAHGEDTVTFWSSNVPGGYGTKTIPKANIKRVLFSRLEHPGRFADVAQLPVKDEYLAAMLKRTSPPAEMMRMVGLGDRVPPPVPASTPVLVKPGATPKSLPTEKVAPGQTPAATPEPKKGFFKKLLGG